MNYTFSFISFPSHLLHFSTTVTLLLTTSRSQVPNMLLCRDYPFSYFLCYIASIHTWHWLAYHMETNNFKDRFNCLRLWSDKRDSPYNRDNYMETWPYTLFPCGTKLPPFYSTCSDSILWQVQQHLYLRDSFI